MALLPCPRHGRVTYTFYQVSLATLLSSLMQASGSDFRLYDGSDLNTYLLMR